MLKGTCALILMLYWQDIFTICSVNHGAVWCECVSDEVNLIDKGI